MCGGNRFILFQLCGSSLKSLRILQEMAFRREEELFHGRMLLQFCTRDLHKLESF